MKRIALSVALLLASVFSNLSGQSSPNYPPASQIKMTTYVLGIIRKGPNWGKGTEEDSKHIQEGHLENIRKMAAAGKLIVAGPLADDALRGIFIFGVSSIDEAKTLVGDDPAVKAGRLVVDYYQWYAAVGLKVDLQTVSTAAPASTSPQREQVVKLVTQIQRADYQGDRAALQRLSGELAPFLENAVGDKALASRIRYWRGFARWRRAINGFNDNVDPKELKEDLKQAMDDFDDAAQRDASFVDAKIAVLSCANLLAFAVGEKDPVRVQELMNHGRQVRRDAEAAAPQNPRLLWALGPALWFTPTELGGGQGNAVAAYAKGLAAIQSHKSETADPLEPSWGEPELLMSLAWSNLNQTKPDLDAAERYARSALQLVPDWHYVRDVLVSQIRKAKREGST